MLAECCAHHAHHTHTRTHKTLAVRRAHRAHHTHTNTHTCARAPRARCAARIMRTTYTHTRARTMRAVRRAHYIHTHTNAHARAPRARCAANTTHTRCSVCRAHPAHHTHTHTRAHHARGALRGPHAPHAHTRARAPRALCAARFTRTTYTYAGSRTKRAVRRAHHAHHTHTHTRTQGARKHAEAEVARALRVVGPYASFASPAPGRTRIGRDTHTRSTQRRRASPLRTPRRACSQRTQGARKHAEVARALRQPPPRPAISADPVGRRAPPVRSGRPQVPVAFVAKKNFQSTSVRVRGQDHVRTSGSLLRHFSPLQSPIEADPGIWRRTHQKRVGTSQHRTTTESRASSGRPAMKRTRGRATSRNARPRRVRRLRTVAPTAVTRPQPPAVA